MPSDLPSSTVISRCLYPEDLLAIYSVVLTMEWITGTNTQVKQSDQGIDARYLVKWVSSVPCGSC